MTELNSLCRSCMVNVTDEEDSVNIFETEDMAEKFMQCSTLKIEPHDQYPRNVCSDCYFCILNFCKFQKMCRESSEEFNRMLETQILIDDMDDINDYMITEKDEIRTMSFQETPVNNLKSPIISKCELVETRDISDPLAANEDDVFEDLDLDCHRATTNKMIEFDHTYSQFSSETLEEGVKRPNNVYGTVSCDDIIEISAKNPQINYCKEERTNSVKTGANVKPLEIIKLGAQTSNSKIEVFLNEENKNQKIYRIQYFSVNEEHFPMLNEISNKEYKVPNSLSENKNAFKYEKQTDLESFPSTKLDINICTDEYDNLIEICTEDDENIEEISQDVQSVTQTRDMESYLKENTEVVLGQTIPSDDTHTIVKKYICNVCSQTFKEELKLCAHIQKMHQDFDGYYCPRTDCELFFNRFVELKEHLNEHDGIPREIYKCHIADCEEKYTNKTSLRLHLRKLHKVGPALNVRKFVCEVCGAVFNYSKSLHVHKYSHVDRSLWPFKCELEGCLRTFRTVIDFKAHKNSHLGIKPFACTYCEKRFTSNANLRMHISLHESEDKRFECNKCNAKFKQRNGLMRHQKLSVCTKSDVMKKDLAEMAKITKQNKPAASFKKYVCETCGANFKYSKSLQVHQYIHVDQSLWPFQCDIDGCTKSYRTPADYKTHKNSHLGFKPFACTYCEKRFSSKANRQVHINFHENKYESNTPFDCTKCGVKFKYNTSLMRHKKYNMCRKPTMPKAKKRAKKNKTNFSEIDVIDESEEKC